jgi:hypothetical protein
MYASPAPCSRSRSSACILANRGNDTYELFCQAQDVGSHFTFRTCADRLAGDGTQTVAAYMRQVRCEGLHKIEVRDSRKRPTNTILARD